MVIMITMNTSITMVTMMIIMMGMIMIAIQRSPCAAQAIIITTTGESGLRCGKVVQTLGGVWMK